MMIIDDFLSEPDLAAINSDITDCIESTNREFLLGWTNRTWQQTLREHSSLVLVCPYPQYQHTVEQSFDDRKILPQYRPLEVQLCVWHRGSFIPFHNDHSFTFAATIYLREWDVDHGGVFLWRDRHDQLQAIEPKANRCVVVDQNETHQVSVVNFDAPAPRFTLQIWGPKIDSMNVDHRDYLAYD